jgi:hypothetical protein
MRCEKRAALKSVHFDLAGAPVEEQLGALLAVGDASKLHSGSDFPFTPWQGCKILVQQLENPRHLDDTALDAVFLDNTYGLFRAAGAPAPKES